MLSLSLAAFAIFCGVFVACKIHAANQILIMCMIAGVELPRIKDALKVMKRNTGRRATIKNAMREIDKINKTALFQTERYMMAYEVFGRHALSMLRLSEEL